MATVAGNTAGGADSSAYWFSKVVLCRVAGGVQCCNCDANCSCIISLVAVAECCCDAVLLVPGWYYCSL